MVEVQFGTALETVVCLHMREPIRGKEIDGEKIKPEELLFFQNLDVDWHGNSTPKHANLVTVLCNDVLILRQRPGRMRRCCGHMVVKFLLKCH